MGKMTKTPFIGHGKKVSDILDLVHTNICDPMSTQARDGYSYITFTDDKSRFRCVFNKVQIRSLWQVKKY